MVHSYSVCGGKAGASPRGAAQRGAVSPGNSRQERFRFPSYNIQLSRKTFKEKLTNNGK